MHAFGEKVRMWIPPYEVESSALDQIRAVAALPEVAGVAVMPDVHAGVGATVGSVIAMRGAVAPMAVGVDIGCGMMAMRLDLPAGALGDLAALRAAIEAAVPVGFNAHRTPQAMPPGRDFLWTRFRNLAPEVHDAEERARLQLGTLGGGNHFIEVCLDRENRVWVMLHSGSRNIGKRIADVHTARARALPENAGLGHLALLREGSPEFEAYWHDLHWAQMYASANRDVMLKLVYRALCDATGRKVLWVEDVVSCHHNYAQIEVHGGERLIVTRKGAISARTSERGIIPGSMGQRSYIVQGLGNLAAYHSASHGAGRKMSRGAAKRAFDLSDVENQLGEVECRKDAGVIDELPGAYKSLDVVMENQHDLVTPVVELRAVLCVKG
jgi:tRNA-splicing ligase RtcB